jgi:membrane-bound lytic murein transglycosylase B
MGDNARQTRRRIGRRRRLGAALLLFYLAAAAGAADSPATDRVGFDLTRPEIVAFIDQVVTRDGLDREQVTTAMAAATVRPELTVAMKRAPEKVLDWWQYRQRFVTPARIEHGTRFWQEHRTALDEVATRSGVPPEYLVAILGVETNYGQVTGTFREIDTLMTYAFDYPERGRFFRSELRAFLLLARDLGRDPVTIVGSYGGALGVPQLMPSNYRKFAAGYSGGRAVDLWTDWQAILSGTAEFLHKHGWVANGPVLVDAHVADGVRISGSAQFALDETVDTLNAKGVTIDATLPGSTPALLVPAVMEGGVQYRVGFKNFYVITRYNPRVNYAMAVCDLAREVRRTIVEQHD